MGRVQLCFHVLFYNILDAQVTVIKYCLLTNL